MGARPWTQRGTLVSALFFVGCTPAAHAPRSPTDAGHARAELGGDVVAVVNGEAITRADIALRARNDHSDATAALRALEDERLWAQAARDRGYGDGPAVADAARRASVRALLAQLEAEVPPSSVDPEAVRARFEATRQQYDLPERRDVVHVLLPVPDGAAAEVDAAMHARAIGMARRLADADPSAREAILNAFDAEPGGVHAEPVNGVAATTPFDEDFIHAIFSQPTAGVLPEPVRAYDGWHVIWVRAVHAASEPVFAEHAQEVAASLLAEARARKLSELIAQLRASIHVALDEEVVRREFAQLESAP